MSSVLNLISWSLNTHFLGCLKAAIAHLRQGLISLSIFSPSVRDGTEKQEIPRYKKFPVPLTHSMDRYTYINNIRISIQQHYTFAHLYNKWDNIIYSLYSLFSGIQCNSDYTRLSHPTSEMQCVVGWSKSTTADHWQNTTGLKRSIA